MVRIGKLDKCAVAALDVFPCQRRQAVNRELLDDKRSHYGAVHHRRAQDRLRHPPVAGYVPHKGTRERVTRAGRIDHVFERIRRHRKERILTELQDAVLAALHQHRVGPHLEDRASALTRLCSPLSIRASSSLTVRISSRGNSLIKSWRSLAIQWFIVSAATIFGLATCSSTCVCRSGEILARKM